MNGSEFKNMEEYSQIEQFYTGKTIFMTGATGYIGKLFLEKLLRSCSGVKKIYVLVRPKKNMSIQQRMDKYFQNIVFDLMKEKHPNFMSKLVPLNGDLIEPGLGLSPEDRRLIIEEAELIIHNGATVIFDMQISIALKINVIATKEMLDLATKCKRLKTFVYVSTAYSHCYLEDIEEKFYDPPADLKMIQDMLKADQENAAGLSDQALEGAIRPWPNTYTFTKATAESIVHEYSKKVSFACGVFRPTIVAAVHKEPLRSWSDNLNGPQLPVLAVALGVIHILYLQDYPMDMIPADMTINALLALIWDLTENKKNLQEAQIYTYGSSTMNPITLRQLRSYLELAHDHPSMKTIWYPSCNFTKCIYNFWILHILLHFLPACLADIYLIVKGEKPMAVSLFFRVTKHIDKVFYFSNGNWKHQVGRMKTVWTQMNAKDHEIFYSDIRKLDWGDYFQTYCLGMRLYLLNDPMETMDTAKRRYFYLTIMHYTFLTVLSLLFLYVMYTISNFVFGF